MLCYNNEVNNEYTGNGRRQGVIEMLLDTGRIADNKLIILYILDRLDMPLTKSQITDVILENSLIDFFTLQQCLSELEQSDLMRQIEYRKKPSYEISETGKKAVEVFIRRIPRSTAAVIDRYILSNKESLKKESEIVADFCKVNDKEYIVTLKVIEGNMVLIDLKLSVVSSKQAKFICEKWKGSSEKIYGQIMNTLIN